MDDVSKFMSVTGMYEQPKDAFKRQYYQFLEEFYGTGELCDSIRTKDVVGVLDGLGDCIFVHNTLAQLNVVTSVDYTKIDTARGLIDHVLDTLNIPDRVPAICRDIVAASNLSKFCFTEEEAVASVNTYLCKGLHVEYRHHAITGLYYVVSTCDQFDVNGKGYHNGKILKANTFQEPDFTGLLEEYPQLNQMFEVTFK
jgi:hypothetical protein